MLVEDERRLLLADLVVPGEVAHGRVETLPLCCLVRDVERRGSEAAAALEASPFIGRGRESRAVNGVAAVLRQEGVDRGGVSEGPLGRESHSRRRRSHRRQRLWRKSRLWRRRRRSRR